jgi:hypothetical protein
MEVVMVEVEGHQTVIRLIRIPIRTRIRMGRKNERNGVSYGLMMGMETVVKRVWIRSMVLANRFGVLLDRMFQSSLMSNVKTIYCFSLDE